MNRTTLVSFLLVIVCLAGHALADGPRLHMTDGDQGTQHGRAIASGKALGDTIYLIGNPYNPDQVSDGGVGPQFNGTFEDQFGNPGWFGWISRDNTYDPSAYWHVSDFNVVSGNWSMWCGAYFDGDPGYGNGWNQSLVFSHQVADAAVPSLVELAATIQNDTEPAYDYTYVEYNLGGIWMPWNPEGFDGIQTVFFSEAVTYQPGDYVGSGGDEIQLRIRFYSDGAWSDEDGLWDTNGACQIDDIIVQLGGVVVDAEDFEDGPDGTYAWNQILDPGVGDYAALYTNLQDVDPCRSNLSAQVAFIDDGVVVPGTGGSTCTTWCYGPGGFIVNNTGGLMGPEFYINNHILSPAVEWPAGADGCYIEFDVFRHEELGSSSVWPGMFYQWHVRAIDTGDPADIENASWRNRSFVQYGGPNYLSQHEVVTDLLGPGRTHVQIDLRVIEYGYVWGWIGTDGTPAPYYDNIKIVAYPFEGPGIAGRSIDWFNDGFPAAGDLDLVDLANNSVRLDAAQNVAQQDDLVNYPGDTCWFDVSAVRTGSVLADMPTMHVRMRANPLFDGVRTLPPNFAQQGDVVEGWVYGDSTFNVNGGLVGERYNFDLPDEGFFFPGDELRYYIRAEDSLGGITLLPGDTTGFSSGHYDLHYPDDFIVRALPTLFTATPGDQPKILFWQDAIDRGGQNEWFYALAQTGFRLGEQYDMYATNGPSSGVGNGLGGRATGALLSGYDVLLYTSSYLGTNLLANGDFENDPSRDIQVVSNWFGQGDKSAFMTGDDLVTGLLDAGAEGAAFVNSYFDVQYIDMSVRSLIGNQSAPGVALVPGNGVIARVDRWVAYGGCPHINNFDALETGASTIRLAEFTDAGGNTGVYPYAAGSYHVNTAENARVVLMPYDFMYLYNAPGYMPPAGYDGVAARAIILEDILEGFGVQGGIVGVEETPEARLAVTSFPNPFNPSTTIRLNLPRSADVSLRIYDLRGALVRTLVQGVMEAGVHDVVWDGRTDNGAQTASGVYFAETRTPGETTVTKLALVK